MKSGIHVLDLTGDIQIVWDTNDPESVERARAEAETLRQQGYHFFLTDGSPADPVALGQALGQGLLNCRHIQPAALFPDPPEADQTLPEAEAEAEAEAEPEAESEAPSGKRGRGRPRKEPVSGGIPAGSLVVATRPAQGG